MSIKNIIGHILMSLIVATPLIAIIVAAIKEKCLHEFVVLVFAIFVFIGLLYLAAWCIMT